MSAALEQRFDDLKLYPAYLQHRIDMFDRLKALEKTPESKKITVKMPDGREILSESFKTTPMDIALSISKSLADRIVIAKVNGELFDLTRPLEGC